jgi:hypothetical protein
MPRLYVIDDRQVWSDCCTTSLSSRVTVLALISRINGGASSPDSPAEIVAIVTRDRCRSGVRSCEERTRPAGPVLDRG